MDAEEYDVIVVGAGMIGSSTAKYASRDLKRRVCLVGPAERTHSSLHSCWYDEGRLYRMADDKPYWGILAEKSISRYPEIARQSGVQFYWESGYLCLASPVCKQYRAVLRAARKVAESGLECHVLNAVTKRQFLPMVSVPEGATAVYEPGAGRAQAGHLSARKMVAAQQTIAKRHGCKIIRQVATDIDKDCKGLFCVSLRDGQVLRAKNVCLCMGTYSKVLPIFSRIAPEMELTLTAQTLAFIEISEEEAARLATLPAIVTQLHEWKYTYIIPPIRYPDGKTYLKLGVHDSDRLLTTLAHMNEYHESGPDVKQVDELVAQARELLPGLKIESVHGDNCVTCNTPGKLAPFIDILTPGLGVATGGCGYAAKSCDEIGRLAATLLLVGHWDSEVPRDLTRVKLRTMAKL